MIVQEEKSEQNYFILLEERISYKIINVCLRSFRSHKLVSHERRNPTRIPKQQNIWIGSRYKAFVRTHLLSRATDFSTSAAKTSIFENIQ